MKYELTDEVFYEGGRTLHRIRALRDIPQHCVKAGDLGGRIESEANLSQDGECWVFGDAEVYGNARVCGDARVYGNARVYDYALVCGDAEVYGNARVCGKALVYGSAQVFGKAEVCGKAEVYGNAEICGHASVASLKDYAVFKNFWSSGRWFTYTRSNRMWKVGCFYGTGEELVAKAYEDGEARGRCYKAFVKAVEAVENEEREEKERKAAKAESEVMR